ncbi:hypothetical protein [Allocoleopsis sp.]|uniref:hypothetical protein n=1 Tax=Allocoleopsis sp. TaxID=3088169 RepID=UPI002FCF8F75
MAKIQVSQPVSVNDEQSLYSEKQTLFPELSSTETKVFSEGHVLRFSEPEFDLKYRSTEEPETQAFSENKQSISPALRQTQQAGSGVAVARYRSSGVRRCGGLSEF